MKPLLLFPTVVMSERRLVENEEKDLWFEAYLKHSAPDGTSHDFVGYETVHHEPQLEFFYKDILMPVVHGYFEMLKVNLDLLDIHVTKSFFNVTEQSGIRKHNHIENHLSFVYYPHVAKQKERNLMLFDPKDAGGNEPYSLFFENFVTEWDAVNASSYTVPVEEGLIYVFPSNMSHDIQCIPGDKPPGILSFRSHKELTQSRFCVAGDMLITRKNKGPYKRSLPPVEDWKVF